ncbi:MAG: histidine kinase dimerization/phospho-acceptor domain-containing protein, partial [bacterium]
MNADTDGQSPLGLLSGGKLPESSITHVQAVLLVDKRERALFATQCPGSDELPVGRVVGQDWRRLFADFEEEEVHSESRPSTCFFTRRGERLAAYRVRRWSAQPIPGTHSGTFVLIEAVADPALVDELIYRERMMALGQIAGGVAHEVNNPLTTVSGWLQILLSETGPEEKRRAPLELMNEEINRIAGIVHHLLSFGRRRRGEERLVRVNRLLDDVLTLVRYQIRNDNIELITELASDLSPVKGAPNQLKQVFLNIIVNARQAMPDGGTLTIT